MFNEDYLDISYIKQLLDLYDRGSISERDFDTLSFIAVEFFSLEKVGLLPESLNSESLRRQLAPIALLAEADMASAENVDHAAVPDYLQDILKSEISSLYRKEETEIGKEKSCRKSTIRINPFRRIIGVAASACAAAIVGGIIYFSISSPSIPSIEISDSYSKAELSCQHPDSSANESVDADKRDENINLTASASKIDDEPENILTKKADNKFRSGEGISNEMNKKPTAELNDISEKEEMVNPDSVINLMRKIGIRVEDIKHCDRKAASENLISSTSDASELIEDMADTFDHIILNVNRTMRHAGDVYDNYGITISESSLSNSLNLHNTIF